MAEVYVNSFAPAKTKIFWGGQIVDPDAGVTVDIFDITQDPGIYPPINTTLPLISNITATKTETDPGSFEINIPFQYTTRNRSLKLKWKYAIASNNVSHETFVDVVTPYASLAEIVEDLGISTDSSDPNYKSYHELIMAEKYARKIIESYTGQNFYLYDDVQIAYGNGSDLLPLPFKLSTLHELYEDDVLLVDNVKGVMNWVFEPETSETGFGLKVDRTQSLDNVVYMANGLVPPSINDRSFGAFKKDARYTVAGKFGWDEVPDNVEQACIQLVGDYFAKDKTWTNRYVKKISTFDWDFEYSSDTYRGTGNAYADQLLYPYVLSNMVVI